VVEGGGTGEIVRPVPAPWHNLVQDQGVASYLALMILTSPGSIVVADGAVKHAERRANTQHEFLENRGESILNCWKTRSMITIANVSKWYDHFQVLRDCTTHGALHTI